ncbi:MAG: hypothetical protein ACP5PB_01250 [Acidimicrobiales bacterium]
MAEASRVASTPAPSRLRRDLAASQILLYGPLLVCALLKPGVTFHEGGISNYGNYLETAPLYIVAFVANAGFLWAVARLIAATTLHRFARPLIAVCVVELLVLVSTFPRHFSFTFSYIHDYLGVVQFAVEFLLAGALVLRRRRVMAGAGLAVEFAGSLIGLLSALKVDHLLFWGQVVGSLGFSVVLWYTLNDLATGDEGTRSAP